MSHEIQYNSCKNHCYLPQCCTCAISTTGTNLLHRTADCTNVHKIAKMSLAGLLSELTISVYPTGPHQTKSLTLTLTVIHTETSAMPNPSPLQYTVVCSKPKAVIRQTLTSVKFNCFNPLKGRGNYIATSNNIKLVHWPLMGGLLHLIQRGGDFAGRSPPRLLLAVYQM